MTKYEILLKTGQAIFNLDDLAVIWKQADRSRVQESARMYVKAAKLFRVSRGIYSINSEFQPAALAAKLNPPSYVTGWYVLSRAGVVYQYYGEGVTSVALRNRQFEIAGQKYSYRQMKREIFFNELGIEKTASYWIASPERALVDVLYFNKSLSFDHLNGLDFAKVQAIGKNYGQNNLLRRLEELFGKGTNE